MLGKIFQCIPQIIRCKINTFIYFDGFTKDSWGSERQGQNI